MGQYYLAVVNDTVYSVPRKSTYGYKLMEHGFFRNPFVNAVTKKIYHNPQKVAWVGDYSNSDYWKPLMDKLDVPYEKIWGDNVVEHEVSDRKFSCTRKYLVNHTTKEYVDMSKPITYYTDYLLHPLPLMTAIGNGDGGGDYFGEDMEHVGDWAGDVLSIEDAPPEDYDCRRLRFKVV